MRVDDLKGWQGVIAKGNANRNELHNYALEISDANRYVCFLGNGSTSSTVTSTVAAVKGQFAHIACVWNGSQLQLYINGVLNTSATQNLTPAANTSPLYIGQFGGNTDRLNGVVDEIRMYDYALTSAQVQSDMNSPI